MAKNPYLDIDQKMLGDIHTSREMMDNLEILCDDYGSRFGGTKGEKLAAQFFRDKFKAYGLSNVKMEPYKYASWTRGETTLEITHPVQHAIPCIALPYCPSATIETELISVGDGAPSDFKNPKRLKNKLVMATSKTPPDVGRFIHRSEKYGRSALAGAAGFIFMNHYEGLGPATGSIADNREAIIPGISVSKEDGEYLQRLLRRKGTVRLKLKTRNRTRQRTSWNVVAELPGNTIANEWVLVGCHYDGHDISQGAHDPISGLAAILDAARVLSSYAKDQIQCGIRFIAFGTEEIGLIGAKEYVKAHKPELNQIRLLLNMDAAGGGGRKGIVMHYWPELDKFFKKIQSHIHDDFPYGNKLSAFSDHFPFFEAGVPTAGMGDVEATFSGRGFGHTAFDTLDKLHLTNLRSAASCAARTLLRIACEQKWPATRRNQKAVKAIIAKEPNLENLKVDAAVERLYKKRGRTYP